MSDSIKKFTADEVRFLYLAFVGDMDKLREFCQNNTEVAKSCKMSLVGYVDARYCLTEKGKSLFQ